MQHCWLVTVILHSWPCTSRPEPEQWNAFLPPAPPILPVIQNSLSFLIFFRERLPGDGEASIDDFDDEDDGIDDLYEDADGADEGMTVNVRYF